MLSTLLTTWRGRMRSEVNDMQMAFFFFFFMKRGGFLALHISLLWQGTELPRAVQHTHVTTDGSLKFLMAAVYRPICSRSRATPLPFVFVLSPSEVNLFLFAETFNHFQTWNSPLNSGIAMNRRRRMTGCKTVL